jgi:hypothetical protein
MTLHFPLHGDDWINMFPQLTHMHMTMEDLFKALFSVQPMLGLCNYRHHADSRHMEQRVLLNGESASSYISLRSEMYHVLTSGDYKG